MPSSRRIDACGMFHHVMNRGLSQRTVFETRRDVRFFLSLLAREVRAGNLRMLAYAILTTHFHLLAQSPRGELSAVMRRVESRYVRYFNRTRDRRGPLFERRFLSKPIGSHSHRLTVLRYIDQNAPEARLVAHASRYPYCSAYHYARARRPKWLDCSYVHGLL